VAIINLFNIYKNYDIKELFKDVNFTLNEGDRVALVGENGCGKSTLIKMIAGEIQPDSGRRVVNNNLIIDILEQNPKFQSSLNLRDAIENELTELKEAKKRYNELSNLISINYRNQELLEEHSKITAYLDHHNAWNLDDKIERVLQEFKLKEYEYRDVNGLSGGEQRRVALASLILKKPDILLLDEPTNHLDVYMVEFLEEILIKERFTLLLISHDRYFINTIATKIVEIENKNIVSYNGGYEQFLIQKKHRVRGMKKEHENLLKLLKKEEEWLRRGVKARLTRNQGRKKRIFELRERAKQNPTLIRKIVIELERERKSFNSQGSISKKKMLFDIENLYYSIGDKSLIEGLSIRILQRDKIAVVGHNGSGKSTFLKILLGRIEPNRGVLKRGDFNIGYFDQHREMLDDNKNIIEIFLPKGGDRVNVYGKSMHIYAYLKSFLFPEEYLQKKIGYLSGGEKNRVALALLFTKKVDCLILDEPTNDLDIQTINILEEKLINFQGALIFVSHDRYFIDKIASKLLIFKGNGRVEESCQNYSEYLSIEKNINELYNIEREIKIKDREAKRTKIKKQSKLSYKKQRDLERLPTIIEKLEKEIEELKRCLSNSNCYKKRGLTITAQELKKREEECEKITNRYLEILEEQEALEGEK
jgi:ATP-binding cassette subfamily F protein uup